MGGEVEILFSSYPSCLAGVFLVGVGEGGRGEGAGRKSWGGGAERGERGSRYCFAFSSYPSFAPLFLTCEHSSASSGCLY